MSSVVVSFATGESFVGENLEILPSQGQEYDIEVLPNGEESGTPVTIVGAGGNDIIDLGAAGDSTALGIDGDDSIMGGEGDDLIDGGEGNDTLKGGMGADVLKGSLGDDVFEFDAANLDSNSMDLITDFGKGEDRIMIMGVSDDVDYDPQTGLVSVDGQEAIDIGRGLGDVEIESDDDGTWEIF